MRTAKPPSAKRVLLLRVMLKLMAWLALLAIIWTAFRYIFNFPEYDNRIDKSVSVQRLQDGEFISIDWAGQEVLILKKSAADYLVVYQRSPEFSCLVELVDNHLQDPCNGDLFDLNGLVLPAQRTARNLRKVDYELLADGAKLKLLD